DVVVARHSAARLLQFGRGRLGVKLDAADPQADAIAAFGAALPDQISLLILTAASSPRWGDLVPALRRPGRRLLVEITGTADAARAEALDIDGLLVKGSEAAGFVGEETTFVLIQRLRSSSALPVWAYGGISPDAAAACRAAGCAGVV